MKPTEERIYLDAINGRPLFPEVREVLEQSLSQWGNPSSLHQEGAQAGKCLDKARAAVAQLVGARASEVIFTASGSEANALALVGLTQAYRSRGNHLVISAIEHLSVIHQARRLEKEGFSVTVVPVDAWGRIDPDRLEKALTPQTILVSIQWANGEVGTVQPMAELVGRVKAKGILFHSDAVSAAGELAIDWEKIPVDALSVASNTLGGPLGIGALILRKGVRIIPQLVGGGQEEGRRAGTENLLGAIGMGEAARLVRTNREAVSQRLISLRDRLIHGILQEVPDANLNGHPTERLPGHASISFPGLDAQELVYALDRKGISVGLGSACTGAILKASHVLKAMGVEESRALGTLVFSLWNGTTAAQIERVLELIFNHEIASPLRGSQ